MTKREQYDLLERTPRHRQVRCGTCQMLLPCRQDGAFGPCDARELTTESMDNTFALIRAVFGVNREGNEHAEANDRRRAKDAALYAAKIANKGRAYGPGRTVCRNGHPQTAENVYEGLRGKVLRRWCRVCQIEKYARETAKRHDKTREIENQRPVECIGETEPVRCAVAGQSDSIYCGEPGA